MLHLCLVLSFLCQQVTAGAVFDMIRQRDVVRVDDADVYGFRRGRLKTVVAYEGIPYALPPVNEHRFRPPVPALLSGTFYANKTGIQCIQAIGRQLGPTQTSDFGQEDCLILNVFTPLNGTNLSVIVFVHGGFYDTGASNYALYGYNSAYVDPTDWMTGGPDFVYVSINYRLGVTGFLAGKQLEAENSLNPGLLDQKLAFEWVRKNIAKFGGDPNRVTGMGHSAGGWALSTHLAANSNLFDAAVILSGGPLFSINTKEENQDQFDEIAKKADCDPTSSTVLDCMRSKKISVLRQAAKDVTFKPVVDGSYVKEAPWKTIKEGRAQKVPLFMNIERNEGTIFPIITGVRSERDADMFINITQSHLSKEQLERLYQLYPRERYVRPYLRAADMYGDASFNCPTVFMADEYSKTHPVYLMENTYMRAINLIKLADPGKFIGKYLGVAHGSIIPFLYSINVGMTPIELIFAKRTQIHVTEFSQRPYRIMIPKYVSGSGKFQKLHIEYIQVERNNREKCAFFLETAR